MNNQNFFKNRTILIFFIIGLITLILFCLWICTIYYKQNNLPWYTDLLSTGTTSFFIAFVIMLFQNQFKENLYKRYKFFRSMKEYKIINMHEKKKITLSYWIRKAKKEVCITGYRLIITLDLIEDLIFVLNKNKKLKIKLLTCPSYTDTYKKIFGDNDKSEHYLQIKNELKKTIKDFDSRIFIRSTDIPLFNDTYIVDDHLITSPYVHNRDKLNEKNGVITADNFFSIEVTKKSHLFKYFEEDFNTVWEKAKIL